MTAFNITILIILLTYWYATYVLLRSIQAKYLSILLKTTENYNVMREAFLVSLRAYLIYIEKNPEVDYPEKYTPEERELFDLMKRTEKVLKRL